MATVTRPYFKYSYEQNKADNPPDGDPTLTVEIRTIDKWGNLSAAATLTPTNVVPSPPTGLTTISLWGIGGIQWVNSTTDKDLRSTFVYRSTTNDRNTATLIGKIVSPGYIYIDPGLATGITYYYWLKYEDVFGQLSDWNDVSGGSITPPVIQASDLYLYVPQFTGVVTNNSPVAGKIAWASCKIIYKGVQYTITDGNTDNIIIYWQLASPNIFTATNTLPALGIDDFIILTNNSGTHERALISSVIEGRYLRALSVTADKIYVASLDALAAYLGTVQISGVCDIGASGGIYQGTGTFASPTTGLKIYRASSIGLLEMWGSGAKQTYMDTDGKLYAGVGAVYLDTDGLTLTTHESALSARIKWKTSTTINSAVYRGSTNDVWYISNYAARTAYQAITQSLVNSTDDVTHLYTSHYHGGSGAAGGWTLAGRALYNSALTPVFILEACAAGALTGHFSNYGYIYPGTGAAIQTSRYLCDNGTELESSAGMNLVTGAFKVADIQVVGARVVDARCDDAINSGDATTDGVIDALRDAMIAHGLIAASADG